MDKKLDNFYILTGCSNQPSQTIHVISKERPKTTWTVENEATGLVQVVTTQNGLITLLSHLTCMKGRSMNE
jgi:hypothetical protein